MYSRIFFIDVPQMKWQGFYFLGCCFPAALVFLSYLKRELRFWALLSQAVMQFNAPTCAPFQEGRPCLTCTGANLVIRTSFRFSKLPKWSLLVDRNEYARFNWMMLIHLSGIYGRSDANL
ncbi:hypothetical protein KC19_4G222400 [Ceratodon purpureus]|uniref:Uncharacterized protein n=1 Tax=Ceratodon purpureus TaxID=3225 RepID=A0A8T0IDS4_CERPU|nr:hypothetical protein KC19_4G222400 [Ceratodon purpureus]